MKRACRIVTALVMAASAVAAAVVAQSSFADAATAFSNGKDPVQFVYGYAGRQGRRSPTPAC